MIKATLHSSRVDMLLPSELTSRLGRVAAQHKRPVTWVIRQLVTHALNLGLSATLDAPDYFADPKHLAQFVKDNTE